MPRTVASRDYGGRTASQRRAERRERLLTAATELFGEDGFSATSIERVCTRANVSTRNFYEEFTGRDSLLVALHDRISQRALDAVLDALASTSDAPTAERVAAAITAYVGATTEDPRWTRIVYLESVGVSAEVERQRLAWRQRLSQLVEAEARRAALQGDAVDRDYQYAAVAFVGAVIELVSQWTIDGRPVPVATICAELTRIALAIISTP